MGAFYAVDNESGPRASVGTIDNYRAGYVFGMDTSRISSTYSNVDTVQPKSLLCKFFIKY